MGTTTEAIMKLKLTRISTKSFIIVFSIINVITGFILGALVTFVSFVAPAEEGLGGAGAWAIIIFPILNGLLGLATGAFLTGMYNFLSQFVGGAIFEFEEVKD